MPLSFLIGVLLFIAGAGLGGTLERPLSVASVVVFAVTGLLSLLSGRWAFAFASLLVGGVIAGLTFGWI